MLPFDWRTPLGYIVAWSCQTAAGLSICAGVIVFGLMFASSWIFVIIADDITQELATFNDDVKKPIKKLKDLVEIKQQFCDVIQIYADAKE